MRLSKRTMALDMGKGSKRRPEDKKKFDVNWDVIFGQAYPKVTRKKKKNEKK